MASELETKTAAYAVKKSELQTLLAEAVDAAGVTAISNIKSVGDNPREIVEQRQKELGGLQDEMSSLRNIEMNTADLKAKELEHEAAMKTLRPDLGSDDKRGVVDDKDDDEWVDTAIKAMTGRQNLDVFESPISMRALFNTGSYDPKTVRDDGMFTPAATRPIQFVQRLRQVPIATDAEVYMLQTAVTDSSTSRTESQAYHELTFAATEQTNPVRGYGAFLPASKWVVADDAMAREMILEQLPLEMMRDLDNDLVNGDGSSGAMTGFLSVTGINSVAKGTDSVPVAISKGIEEVETVGFADPDFVIMHPSDWWDVARLQTTDGVFIMGQPSEVTPMRLWGLPVYKVQALPEGTALTGAFSMFSHIRDRQSLTTYWMEQMRVASSHTVPTGNTMLVGDVRMCLTVRRPSAFSEITGI